MKKFLFTIGSTVLLCLLSQAQTNVDVKEQNFDKRFRFGLRASPQPTWFKSGNNASSGAGANFGFGFGLTMEFRLSNIIHFQTGIGGDFEGGKISYENNSNFNVKTVIDDQGEPVEAKKNIAATDYNLKAGSTQYVLKQRVYNSTMVTIPLLLKMMTQEYNGMRYFALFGGELGIRAGVKANDTYVSGITINNITGPAPAAQLTKNGIDVGRDGSLVPLRFGMNLGLGTEYRLAGTTSLVFSVNYFQSFTNLMRNNSKYLTTSETLGSNGTYTFSSLSQSYLMRSVRINIGIMF